MKLTRGVLWVVFAVGALLSWASCGGVSVEQAVGPTGGELCTPDHRFCIEFPGGAIDTQELLRLTSNTDVPGGAFSDGFEVRTSSGKPLTLLKSAVVKVSIDEDRTASLDNLNILRVYRKSGDDWLSLDKPFVDRVKNAITGETPELSVYVVLRSDRLPDGGLPIELDSGVRDSGVIVIPPFDAGRPDAGRPDAGTPDAGFDAGTDAGLDAGPHDSGVDDAGTMDAGTTDAGAPDAGPPDAGTPDAGPPDAGDPDAGPPDAGEPDAGPPDAGEPDAGSPDAGDADAGEDAG